jgi:hypothetical protein
MATYMFAVANVEQIDKAKEMIKKLQFAFRSENFENPALQKHYASVEAMALDRDNIDEPTDFTRKLRIYLVGTMTLVCQLVATDVKMSMCPDCFANS